MTSNDVESYIVKVNASPEMSTLFRQFGIRYRWYAMTAVICANIAAVLASTIINVAVPDIMGSFGIGQDRAQWLATANLAAATVAMLCIAWTVGRVGLRATVLLGMAMTVIFQVFPHGKQGVAMGISSIGIILAPAIGPAIGGMAVDALNWRYVFYLGIPISVVSLLLASVFLPGKTASEPKPFDWIGLVLLSIALVSVLVGLSNGEREGWSSTPILSYFLVFVVCGTGFIYWENKQAHPLLDIELFRQRNFSIMCIVAFVFGAGLYASTYLIPLFLQLAQHMSPTESGFLLMPAGFIMVLAFPLSGKLSDRYDRRLLITAGILFFALAFWLMAGADAGTSFWTFAFWVILSRIGIGLVMPALQMGALQGIEVARINAASGSFSFIRQLGGAFGVNLTSILLERRTAMHREIFADTQTYANGDTMEVLQSLSYFSQQMGFVGTDAWNAARSLLQQMINAEALVAGFKDSFVLLTLVFLVALLPTWMLRRTVHR